MMTHPTPIAIDAVALRETPRPRDVEAVRGLVSATRMFSAEEVAIAAELVEETLRDAERAGYRYLFADADSRLLGYACYGRIPLTRSSFDLYWIAVEPSQQHRGVGGRLLRGVESAVQREGGRMLYVDTSGRAAYAPTRAFYERRGYHRAALLEDFYAPGDAKVIYAKRLAPEA